VIEAVVEQDQWGLIGCDDHFPGVDRFASRGNTYFNQCAADGE